MKDIYELIKERNNLPLGSVYEKTINNNVYFYHQYSLNGVKKTKIVNKDQVDVLIAQIKKRKELDKEIKTVLKSGNKNLALSKNARELTGYVMNKDKVVATFEKGTLVSFDNKLCPLIIIKNKALEPFLKNRVIDSGRTNSRLIKKVLNIKQNEDELVSLCSYSASIADDYWFKPLHSKLKYKDINFNNDIFFNLSLKGLIGIYPNKLVVTPELTTNGSYEKGWKNIDGEWWLYKAGTNEEIFSELFYSNLFELLKLPTAHYEYEDGYIKSKNFSSSYNFEPMLAIAGDNESYDYIYDELCKIKPSVANEYIRLCFFDVVLNNVDRHNENCGILRDKKTGEVISLAPNYDDNLSLIARTKELDVSINEGFLKHFVNELNKHKKLKEALKHINIPKINEKILDQCFKKVSIKVNNEKQIKTFILNRYNYLLQAINN